MAHPRPGDGRLVQDLIKYFAQGDYRGCRQLVRELSQAVGPDLFLIADFFLRLLRGQLDQLVPNGPVWGPRLRTWLAPRTNHWPLLARFTDIDLREALALLDDCFLSGQEVLAAWWAPQAVALLAPHRERLEETGGALQGVSPLLQTRIPEYLDTPPVYAGELEQQLELLVAADPVCHWILTDDTALLTVTCSGMDALGAEWVQTYRILAAPFSNTWEHKVLVFLENGTRPPPALLVREPLLEQLWASADSHQGEEDGAPLFLPWRICAPFPWRVRALPREIIIPGDAQYWGRHLRRFMQAAVQRKERVFVQRW